MSKNAVNLYIYELSRGLARQMSPLLLGKQIDGIWHTGIVVYGREYFFGGGGIEYCFPGGTILGEPDEIIDLGETQIAKELFEEYLGSLGKERFRPEMYHLFEHNCNTFSNEIAQFLTGRKIPKHIQDLPNDVMNTAFGSMIKPLVDSMSVRPAGGASLTEPSSSMDHSVASGPEGIFEPRVQRQGTGNDTSKQKGEQHFTARPNNLEAASFHEKNLASILLHIKEELQKDSMEKQDFEQFQELETVLLQKEFVLKEENIGILGKVVDKCITEHRHLMLAAIQVLKEAARSNSFISSPKGGEVIQRVAEKYSESTSKDIQLNILYTLCNACSSSVGHNILIGTDKDSSKLTSLVVDGLLSGVGTEIQDAAVAVVYNIALEKVSNDISLECSTALMEVLAQTKAITNSESGFRSLFALKRFMEWNEEVKRLAVVMGLDVERFRGKTQAIDRICSEVEQMLK